MGRQRRLSLTGGRRGRSRLHVRLPARLSTVTETVRVVLNDLSLTGAQLLVGHELRVGTEALLEWNKFDAFGEVVWSDGNRAGMRFETMLDPETVLSTRDMDDSEHLPSDFELIRRDAREWVQGGTRPQTSSAPSQERPTL